MPPCSYSFALLENESWRFCGIRWRLFFLYAFIYWKWDKWNFSTFIILFHYSISRIESFAIRNSIFGN